ncbi:MAG TPA: GNAT family N-acetyltransferase [Burkholderiaceae bacterium]
MTATQSAQVRHNVEARRFEAEVDGRLCRADYLLAGDTMRLIHTEVHPALEGRGIASALVRAAFDHAAANGLKIAPACSYVRAWARRHPELGHLLAR